MKAGPDCTIDLSFDSKTKEVIETKLLPDRKKIETRIHIDDFEPALYGDQGWIFLCSIAASKD